MKKLGMLIFLGILLTCCTPAPSTIIPSSRYLTSSEEKALKEYCYPRSNSANEYADCMMTAEIPTQRFQILDMNYKRDGIGNFIVIGIVKNIGDISVRFVKISCQGFDSSGKLVDTHTTYMEPGQIKPNDEGTFTCYLDEIKPISKFHCTAFVD